MSYAKLFFLFSALVGLTMSQGPLTASGSLDKALENAKKRLDADLSQPIGSAAAILHRGKIIYQKVVGHTYKGGPAITANTYFALGSTSKPIAALVMHDLVAGKQVQLETSLASMVSQVPLGVQLHHILSHTSGYTYKGNIDIEHGRQRPAVLALLFKSPLENLPGQKFLYNNAAYSLLEDVATKATGKPWPNVFREVLAKRGLSHLALSDPGPDQMVAYPHAFNRRKKTFKVLGRLPKNYPTAVSSSAGVFASLNDLVAFAKLQLTDEFSEWHKPRAKAQDALAWNLKLPFPKQQLRSSYALGWRVFELKEDAKADSRLVFHGGYLNGISAFVGLMKKHELAVVVLANKETLAQRAGFYLWSEVVAGANKDLLVAHRPLAKRVNLSAASTQRSRSPQRSPEKRS